MTLYFLSTSIISLVPWVSEATIEVKKYVAEPNDAKTFRAVLNIIKDVYDQALKEGHNVVNAISHEGTLRALNDVLGTRFTPSKEQVFLKEGDIAIAVRPYGGRINRELSEDELVRLGVEVYIYKVSSAR